MLDFSDPCIFHEFIYLELYLSLHSVSFLLLLMFTFNLLHSLFVDVIFKFWSSRQLNLHSLSNIILGFVWEKTTIIIIYKPQVFFKSILTCLSFTVKFCIFAAPAVRKGIPGRHEPPLYRKESPPYRSEPPWLPYRTRASAIQYTSFCHTERLF